MSIVYYVADHYEQAKDFTDYMRKKGHERENIKRLNMYKPQDWVEVKDCLVHKVDLSSLTPRFINHCQEYKVTLVPISLLEKKRAVMK